MKKTDSIYNPQKYPMLLPSLAFILGIIVQNFWSLEMGLLLTLILLAIIVNFSLDKIAPKLFNKLFWQNGLLLFVFTCLGALRICVEDSVFNSTHIIHFLYQTIDQDVLKGIVKEIETGDKNKKIEHNDQK